MQGKVFYARPRTEPGKHLVAGLIGGGKVSLLEDADRHTIVWTSSISIGRRAAENVGSPYVLNL